MPAEVLASLTSAGVLVSSAAFVSSGEPYRFPLPADVEAFLTAQAEA